MNSTDQGASALACARDVLAILNSLHVGELQRLQGELERARLVLAEMGQAELEARVREAQDALGRGDMKEFRRALANVTARLGHVK